MPEGDPLRGLLDKQSITEVIYRYARAIDRCDSGSLRNCFHPDSTHEHGEFEGTSLKFCDWAMELLQQLTATQHHIGNILIDLEGDRAFTETYWIAYHRIPAGAGQIGVVAGSGTETDLLIGGRYLDRFERRSGLWKIARRVGIHDWQRFQPAADGGFFESDPRKRGARGPADRSYQRQV